MLKKIKTIAMLAAISGVCAFTVEATQAAEQQILELQTNTILNLVSRRLMDGPIGLVSIMALGVEYQDATAKIALAVAKATEPPKMEVPAKESAEVARVRTIKTDEAIQAFRGGLASEAELTARLRAAGQSDMMVEALVSREQTRATLDAQRQMEQLAQQILKEALKAEALGQVVATP